MMKLFTKLVLIALVGVMLVPHTAYAADNRKGGEQFQSDNGHDDDDDRRKKKPRFQTKFFSDN